MSHALGASWLCKHFFMVRVKNGVSSKKKKKKKQTFTIIKVFKTTSFCETTKKKKITRNQTLSVCDIVTLSVTLTDVNISLGKLYVISH